MRSGYVVGIVESPQMSASQEKTLSITFRLPKRVLEQLELEAGQNNVSENVLVKQILTNYVDWTRLSNGTGLLPITKNCFRKLSKSLDVDSAQELVEDIHSMIKNFAMIKYGRYDQSGAIELLSMYLSMSNFSLVHMKEGMMHRFLVTHGLGIGFSLILEQLFKNIFSEFNDPSGIRFKTSDDSMMASGISG